jgi:lipopolysaccharide export system protein LptC
MSIEANVVPGGSRYRLRTVEERELAFLAAERHTRFVRFLRKTLPVLALLVLAAYFISTQFSVKVGVGDMTASIDGIEVSGGNLRMVNPKLKGTDKRNGAYIVSAAYADQDIKNPKIVKLNTLKAELSNPSGNWSRMNATRGVFDSTAERLVMQEKIAIATSSGVTGELTHATLDMKTQTLRSHRPVYFKTTGGTVRANALTFRSADSTLTFRGKVHVHLTRDQAKAPKPASPALPAPNTVPPLPGALPQEDAGVTGIEAPQ